MHVPRPQQLLEVWERGVRRHPLDRALLLLSLAEPGIAPEHLADLPISRRNASIMALRTAWLGNPLPVWCDCQSCGERMELTIDARALPPPPARDTQVEIDGMRFLPPTSRQLAALLQTPDAETAARILLAASAESPQHLPTEQPALQTLLDAVDAALEEADPWLDISLAVNCPACSTPAQPSLDVAAIVWDELDAIARRLLDEVHLLARSYGWSEHDILGLSEHRRAAYLERVQA